jgi:hypothetical protein
MLTKQDLQGIGNLVEQKISQLVPGIVKQELKPVRRDIRKLRKDLEFAIGSLDKDRWKLEQRVDKIDAHLGISTIVN